MITFVKIKTGHPEYKFVEELLHRSFPEIERRPDEQQRRNTDTHERFGCYVIRDTEREGTETIGLITVWNLDGFTYVEHLAVSPAARNRGYGKLIMEELILRFPGLIVLEVEKPEDEMSTRRIGFYRRCGFDLCLQDYVQPPYRSGGDALPLYLMFTGARSIDERFGHIKRSIHRIVYGVVG